MKTNKVNPLTAFRKLTETRQTKVKKSMKKAQDGIEMNDEMINKAGSTGGYKKPANWWAQDAINLSKGKPWEDTVKLINRQKTDTLNQMYPNYQIPPKKKGGSVKRKK